MVKGLCVLILKDRKMRFFRAVVGFLSALVLWGLVISFFSLQEDIPYHPFEKTGTTDLLEVPETKSNELKEMSEPLPLVTETVVKKVLVSENKTDKNYGAFEKNSKTTIETTEAILAIILVDVGDAGLSSSELLKINFPATFGVYVTEKNALENANSYFDAGYEVLIVNPESDKESLASDLLGDDLIKRLDTYLTKFPMAIGLLDNAFAELQKNSNAQQAILNRFSQTGHALLSYKRGLDSTGSEAQKREVPTGSVFRILDGVSADETSIMKEKIMRNLDRAVLKANEEGSVIVLAIAHEDTIDAIDDWILANKDMEGISLGFVSGAINALHKKS